MGRWEPGAAGRLREAAMALYVERGYEQTTVADIAERAGLTARTFFRHFADKREVLFAGSEVLQDNMIRAVDEAPEAVAPLAAVGLALDAAAATIGGNRQFSLVRQQVIAGHPELRERELAKMASLSALLADALRRRGVPDAEAALAAETGIAVFRVAFPRWLADGETRALAEVMREGLDRLRALAA